MKNITMLLCLGLASCTDPGRSQDALQKSGYTDIEIGDYDFNACGKDDEYSTHFRAKNPQGRIVEGTVCCGVWKSCTIRF